MRCRRSVADPPDDPVVVEAAGEVAERLVELLDGPESVQPEQLLLQPPRLLRLHAAVLVAPAVEGLLAHAEVLEHLRHRAARRDHGVGLAKLVDDLLRGVSCPFHRESPGPSRGRSGLT
jgi:hypothetical protein